MAKKRSTPKGARTRNGAAHPFTEAWSAAYRDALYNTMSEAIEHDMMRDPEIRAIVQDAARRLASAYNRLLAGEKPTK